MSENITAFLNIVAKDDASNVIKKVADKTSKQKNEVDQLIGSTKRLVERQNRQVSVLKQLKAAQANATEEQKAQLAMLEKQIQAQGKATNSLRMIRGGFGQMGHQVQDVAVQLQSGTDAMIVFGQQGSQIVSLFGPGGAMIGALLAVGAAIFSGVTMMSREAKKEVEELTEEISKQRKELGLLTDAELEYQRLQRQKQTDEQIKKQRKLEEQVAFTTETYNRYKRLLDGVAAGEADALFSAQLMELTHEDLQSEVDGLNEKLVRQRNELAQVTAAGDDNTRQVMESTKAEKERAERVEGMILSLIDQANKLGLNAREQALYTATLKGAKPEELAAINRIYDRIEAYNEQQAAIKEAARAEAQRQREVARSEAQQAASLNRLMQGLENYTLGREGVLARNFATETMMIRGASLEAIGSEERRNNLLLALRQKFLDDVQALRSKGSEGGTSEDPSLKQAQKIIDQMRDFGKSEIQILAEQASAKIAILQNAADQEVITQAQAAETIRLIRQQLADNLEEIRQSSHEKEMQRAQEELDKQFEIIGGYQTLENAASEALTSVFTHAQDADDALRAFGKTIVDEAIKGLIKMGMQQIKNALIQDMIAKTAMTQAVATQTAAGAAIAAAMAPAALATSLATAGTNAAGATAGIAATSAALKTGMLASYEGGGFTGSGSRSGGVDGRGGFPAILHPNETVIDHQGGGMQPVVVNQTINVTTGVQQTVRAEIANLMPQISEAAKSAVAEGRMRGGSYGTQMGV